MTLYAIALHCIKIDWRRGVPKVTQGISVGSLAAPDEATVRAWAEAAIRKKFPAHQGWEGHQYSIAAAQEAQLDAVRPVKAKARKLTPREAWEETNQ